VYHTVFNRSDDAEIELREGADAQEKGEDRFQKIDGFELSRRAFL
jgi:hypothetical protein